MRSQDEIIRDTLGNVMLQVIQLQIQLELAQAEIARLKQHAGSAPSPANQ